MAEKHDCNSFRLLGKWITKESPKLIYLLFFPVQLAFLPCLWPAQNTHTHTQRYNTTILLDQENDLVPNGAIFLDYHDCGSVERTGTIPLSTKVVFLPIAGEGWFDVDDDFNSTRWRSARAGEPNCSKRWLRKTRPFTRT